MTIENERISPNFKKLDYLPEVALTPLAKNLREIAQGIEDLQSAYEGVGMQEKLDRSTMNLYLEDAERELDRLKNLRKFYSK
jgi:hypothetical protein